MVHGRAGAVGVVQKKGDFSGFARSLCRDVVHLSRSNLQDVCFINTRFTRLGWHGRYGILIRSFWFWFGGQIAKKQGLKPWIKIRQYLYLMIDALMPRQE